MKITIDTSSTPHRVEIEGDCTIGELIEFLSKYYGDFTWRDVRISARGYTINVPRTQPFIPLTNPGTGVWPTIGSPQPWVTDSPFRIGDFPGTTLIYQSDTNTITDVTAGTTFNLA